MMYDYSDLKTKLKWKVAAQWAGEAKQEMEKSKQLIWVRVRVRGNQGTLHRPGKHTVHVSLPMGPDFGFGIFLGLCAFNS